MFERFTDRARRTVVLAQEEARLLGHNYIGSEHLLLGLLHEGGAAAECLAVLEVKLDDVRERVASGSRTPPSGHIPFTDNAKLALERSLHALDQGHNYIASEHILLGLMQATPCEGVRVLAEMGVTPDDVSTAVRDWWSKAESGAEGQPSDVGGEAWQRLVSRRRAAMNLLAGIAASEEELELVCCSFCGGDPSAVGRLVHGRGGAIICEQCIRSAAALIEAEAPADPQDPGLQVDESD